MSYNTLTDKLIEAGFAVGAIQIKKSSNIACPCPVHVNIQELMKNKGLRSIVTEALVQEHAKILASSINPLPETMILGMTFEGIPAATLLAQKSDSDLYTMKMGSEKIPDVSNLHGKNVIIVTGVVETGKNLSEVAHAVIESNGECNHAISIFAKEHKPAQQLFSGEMRIDSGGRGGRDKKLPLADRTIHGLITPGKIFNFMMDPENRHKAGIYGYNNSGYQSATRLLSEWTGQSISESITV